MNPTICFIGAGNMAASLIGGLIADGYAPQRLRAADPDDAQRERLRARFGVTATADNHAAVADADVVVFAVKPQQLRAVATELGDAFAADPAPLAISIAAGVTEPALRGWLGGAAPIVRCMPNTPALLRAGASGLYANPQVSAEQRRRAERILGAVGSVTWVDDESLLDAVTAVSGSGPAYFFWLMETLERTGVELGLSREQARSLTLQTALGAARMALENDAGLGPAELRAAVTSPGGTTERALSLLADGDAGALVAAAVRGAAARCRELADELENRS